jgi:AcrR family transcriptional regulator
MQHGFAAATTLDIATRAQVSKRELYALVGDKEAMLAACIGGRGDRMRLPEGYPPPKDRAGFRRALGQYAATTLAELMDPNVLAAFRLGIAESKRSPAIGQSILARGRQPSRAALKSLLESARAARLLAEGDLDEMASHFHALLWGDLMVWVLLGTQRAPATKEIRRRADEASDLFLALHGR